MTKTTKKKRKRASRAAALIINRAHNFIFYLRRTHIIQPTNMVTAPSHAAAGLFTQFSTAGTSCDKLLSLMYLKAYKRFVIRKVRAKNADSCWTYSTMADLMAVGRLGKDGDFLKHKKKTRRLNQLL